MYKGNKSLYIVIFYMSTNKQNKLPLVINLIAGPCAGKSTLAAGLFYHLKCNGVNCEMASEYAKDCVYNENFKTMDNQVYIFAKQHHKIWRLKDKVDVIIVDSPLILSLNYNREKSEYFNDFVIEQYNKFNNKMYYIERGDEEFIQTGRKENFQESMYIDGNIQNILVKYNIPYTYLKRDDAMNYILNEINEYLKESK